MKPFALLLPLALAMAGAPASARDRIAPLPDGIQPSTAKKVHGLYAEGAFRLVDVDEDLERLESECKDRGVDAKVEGRDLAHKGMQRLYRTRTSVAVFEDTPTINVDRQACSAVITLSRSATVRTGPWPTIRTPDWNSEPVECLRFLHRCWKSKVAGVKAHCVDQGDGLVGTTLCYSVQDDLSKDLVVARSRYIDDGSMPNSQWALDLIVTDALIDPAVFADAAASSR
ncbi:MAG: hypothetical protein QOE79_2740 [Sphingomonadales bacterium]|nr:hypothetical protein [Sphingomonadales bacterium]